MYISRYYDITIYIATIILGSGDGCMYETLWFAIAEGEAQKLVSICPLKAFKWLI